MELLGVRLIAVIVNDLRLLFNQPSQEEYQRKFGEVSGTWDKLFLEYYVKSIHPEVDMQGNRKVAVGECGPAWAQRSHHQPFRITEQSD